MDSILVLFLYNLVLFPLVFYRFPQWVLGLAGLLVSAAYFTLRRGRTVGKTAAGIAVLPAPSLARALGRYAAYYLSLLPAGAGFLAAAFSREKRALHDFLVDTRVVRETEIPVWRKALVVGAVFLPFLAGVLV